MDKIEIHPCGTKVFLKTGGAEGYISEVSIKFDNVQYFISYWNNGVQTCWVNEKEFSTTNQYKTEIGFKNEQ